MANVTLYLLSTGQALLTVANSVMVMTSMLVVIALTGNAALGTIPAAILHVANTVSAMPASLLMARFGRRAGFVFASTLGMAGAALACQSIIEQSFIGFCLAMGLIGAFNGFAQYFRFAATEVVEPGAKPRALSMVLAGGVVAAFLGPLLANNSKDLLVGSEFAGTYAALIAVYALVFVASLAMRIPKPSVESRRSGGRELKQIFAQHSVRLAVLSAAVGYAMMAMLMNATPVAMGHSQHGFASANTVIQWHVVAMFAPSFFTGQIIQRIGVLNVIAAGAFFGLLSTMVACSGQSFSHFWIGLVALGLSWNFLFVGGSALLTDGYTANEKAKTQGANDILVFSMVGLGSLLSGFLYDGLGWPLLNILSMPFFSAVLVYALWQYRQQRKLSVPNLEKPDDEGLQN